MAGLVREGELETFLHHSVIPQFERTAIRVAEGWLRSVTPSLAQWPDPVPEDLWAWAIELTSIAYSNPQGLLTRTAGEETQVWAATRRQEILDAAAEAYGGTPPQGSFPPAPAWPL